MDMLDTQVFGGVTVMHLVIGFIALMVSLKLWDVLKGKAVEPDHYESARCGCGWKGRVSKFTRTCPKCNNDIVRG